MKIAVLCGSIRSSLDDLRKAELALTMQGWVVLFPVPVPAEDHNPYLDAIHLARIHYAAEHGGKLVYLTKPDGTIGISTQREREYGLLLGMEVEDYPTNLFEGEPAESWRKETWAGGASAHAWDAPASIPPREEDEEIPITPHEFWLGQALDSLGSLLLARRREYGSRNISDTGLIGIMVRLTDKVARLRMQEMSGSNPSDTLMDIAGYALIGLSLEERGEW